MQLHCLGTAGYHPNDVRQTSCYFLPESGIVLDAGTGIFRLPDLITTPHIDILLSHAHLDHIAGLTFLLDVFFQRPVDQVRIWGERAKLDAIRTHLFSELVFPVALDVEWCAIDAAPEFSVGTCQVSWRRQDHPGGSVGYRLDWPAADGERSGHGVRLLYLTDTTGDDSDEAIEWNQDANLMMHECYFPAAQSEWATKTGHSWTHRVAEIATRSQPKSLLLTHVNPLSESPESLLQETCERLGETAIDVSLANDGQMLQF